MPAPADRKPASLVELLHPPRCGTAARPGLCRVGRSRRRGCGDHVCRARPPRSRAGGRIVAMAPPGERALLLFPERDRVCRRRCLACLCAGIVAVPLMLPRRQTARDAGTAFRRLCASPRPVDRRIDRRRARRPQGRFAGAIWRGFSSDQGEAAHPALPAAGPGRHRLTAIHSVRPRRPRVSSSRTEFLLANLAMIQAAFGQYRRSTYDLAGRTTRPWADHPRAAMLYLGSLCVLMSPVAFLQRRLNWLARDQRLSSGGPRAAEFRLRACAPSRYRPEQMAGITVVVQVGSMAPSVRAGRLRGLPRRSHPRFSAATMHPAYGMAEATVLISGGRRGAGR